MLTSTQSATLLAPSEIDPVPEPNEAAGSARREIPPVALSSRAKERLRVLNRILGTARPQPILEDNQAREAVLSE